MCLYTKSNKPFVAKKDIECYKILFYETNGQCLRTPYQNLEVDSIPYRMDDTLTPKDMKFEGTYKGYKGDYNLFSIEGGYIHALREKKLVHYTYNQVIVKSIIPKGTRYFVGELGDICAEVMVLSEIIPRKELIGLKPDYIDYFFDTTQWEKKMTNWDKIISKISRLWKKNN